MKVPVIVCIVVILLVAFTACGGNEAQDKKKSEDTKNTVSNDASKGLAKSLACTGTVCPEGNICATAHADGKYYPVGFNTESGVERCCVGGVCVPDVRIGPAQPSVTPTSTALTTP
jgi:hypothetical protein